MKYLIALCLLFALFATSSAYFANRNRDTELPRRTLVERFPSPTEVGEFSRRVIEKVFEKLGLDHPSSKDIGYGTLSTKGPKNKPQPDPEPEPQPISVTFSVSQTVSGQSSSIGGSYGAYDGSSNQELSHTLSNGKKTYNVIQGTQVTVKANPSASYYFQSWLGPAGIPTTSPSFPFTIEGGEVFTAVFAQERSVTVTMGKHINEGSLSNSLDNSITVENAGHITSSDEKMVCQGAVCTATGYSAGSLVTLTVHPHEGWIFKWWSGSPGSLHTICGLFSREPCQFQIHSSQNFYAYFAEQKPSYHLTVGWFSHVLYPGWTATSSDGSIDCVTSHDGTDGSCEAVVPSGTELSITVSPGQDFLGWYGTDCKHETSTTCTIVVDHRVVLDPEYDMFAFW